MSFKDSLIEPGDAMSLTRRGKVVAGLGTVTVVALASLLPKTSEGGLPATADQARQTKGALIGSVNSTPVVSPPENPSDMKIEAQPPQKYMPHDVKAGETISGIVHEEVEDGYIDPDHEGTAVATMVANNGGTDQIGEKWGVQVPVDRTSLPITAQNAE